MGKKDRKSTFKRLTFFYFKYILVEIKKDVLPGKKE